MRKQRLLVVAGPNGNGKSTLTQIEGNRLGIAELIDPDAIARSMGQDAVGGVEIAAAREALKRQREAIAASRSFLIETTLSGKGVLHLMNDARLAGFGIGLYFICVGSVELAVYRVRNRVARGGHDVPVEDICRRYTRSLANLPLVMARADECFLFDNSLDRKPHRGVAFATGAQCWIAANRPEWASRAVEAWRVLQHKKGRKVERTIDPGV